MICPKCGKELEEGKLLCENCGEEIKMVPIFDIELEDQLRESISSLLEDMAAEDLIEDSCKEKTKQELNGTVKKTMIRKYFSILSMIRLRFRLMLIAFLIVLLAGGILFANIHARNKNKDNSFAYQYENAVECAEQENYTDAVGHLERALAIESDDLDARFLLAKYYDKNGQQQSTITLLEEILEIGTEYSHRDEVYDMLLDIYVDRSDYNRIGDLLKDCDVSRIVSKYNKYAAFKPKFNKQGGLYDELISITLAGNAPGVVYYTLDNSIPTKDSLVYETPILLEAGDHVIRAKFVNVYGVESEIETQSYQVHVATPVDPVIRLDSGTYHTPQMIEVYHSKDTNVYYTVDGSTPDRHSLRYTEPMELPYGTSNFAFIAINEAKVSSDVVKRTYQLEVQANFDVDLALQVLRNNLCAGGILLNVEGNVPERFGVNQYEVRTLYQEGENIFYIVYEAYKDSTGRAHDTNEIYAIDVNTADLYKAYKIQEGEYSLRPFEEDSIASTEE